MIKVIENNDAYDFETGVNNHLKKGYKILSTNCGFINSEQYNFCSCFQAILVKEEVK